MALDIRETEQAALAYLSAQLGARAPQYLRLEGEFDESPLEDEGSAAVFSFELVPGGGSATPGAAGEPECATDRKHYVCAGTTAPNFFPAYGFDVEDAYSFHLGTQFMLAMGVQKIDDALEPPGARARTKDFVAHYARGVSLDSIELAALFRCEEQYLAVYRLTLSGDSLFCLGADCPPGFYRLTQYPPQVVLRLHLGKLIRAEARNERERDASEGKTK